MARAKRGHHRGRPRVLSQAPETTMRRAWGAEKVYGVPFLKLHKMQALGPVNGVSADF